MKIIAVGMNYARHNKELGHTQVNTEPVIFMKPDSAILKDGKPFIIPDFSKEIHYETELVIFTTIACYPLHCQGFGVKRVS